MPSEQQAGDIAGYDRGINPLQDLLQHINPENQHQRADIDAAKAWYHVPDAPQRRLGDAIEKIADRPDKLVPRIEHAELGEHVEECGQDDRPLIQP